DSSSTGESPTMRTCTGSMPSASSERARKGPLRSVRSPRTSSEPVTTMAARTVARASGSLSSAARPLGALTAGSGGVAVPAVGRHRQDPGPGARDVHAPARDGDDEVLRRADVQPEALAVDRLRVAALERALEEDLAAGPGPVDDHLRGPLDRRD